MSYDHKTDRMNWYDEISWFGISLISGILLSALFLVFEKFPNSSTITLFTSCIAGFYLLSILARLQNHRGKVLSGKTGIKDKNLKFVFPILGFVIGLSIILFD